MMGNGAAENMGKCVVCEPCGSDQLGYVTPELGAAPGTSFVLGVATSFGKASRRPAFCLPVSCSLQAAGLGTGRLQALAFTPPPGPGSDWV